MTSLNEKELTEAFEYLDELRESGVTNMFGATEHMVRDLAWPKHEAKEAHLAWMQTFNDSPVAERVEDALAR